jgi:hypothetical protein
LTGKALVGFELRIRSLSKSANAWLRNAVEKSEVLVPPRRLRANMADFRIDFFDGIAEPVSSA